MKAAATPTASTPAWRSPTQPWVLTHNGAAVPLEGHVPESSISVRDIAASLAKINRWTGHTVRPISVAEHSLLVVEIAERELALHQPAALLAALLHDAHEAYFGDISTPVKRSIGRPLQLVEAPLAARVVEVFGVSYAASVYRSAIAACDAMAAATELRDLMPPSPARSAAAAQLQAQPVTWINLRARDGMAWQDWQQAFLDRFADLYGATHAMAPEDVLPAQGA